MPVFYSDQLLLGTLQNPRQVSSFSIGYRYRPFTGSLYSLYLLTSTLQHNSFLYQFCKVFIIKLSFFCRNAIIGLLCLGMEGTRWRKYPLFCTVNSITSHLMSILLCLLCVPYFCRLNSHCWRLPVYFSTCVQQEG